MFSYKRVTPLGGDETAGYEILFQTKYTVKEFVQKITTGGHGYIQLYNVRDEQFCVASGQYGFNEPLDIEEILKFSDDQVIKVTCQGGWGRMDYQITVIH